MDSLENGVLLKKDQQNTNNYNIIIYNSNNNNNNKSIGRVASFPKQSNRPRSRLPRVIFSKRLGYIQWICTIVVFSLLLVVFQAFLPGSLDDNPVNYGNDLGLLDSEDLMYLKNVISELNFGEAVKFHPKLLAKFNKETAEMNVSSGFRRKIRFAYRKPKLALVFADLAVDQYQILMASVATALQEIGYKIEVFSGEDGPAHAVWQEMGIPVAIIEAKNHCHGQSIVDWLNYDAVLVNSLEAKDMLFCFMQEPFKSIPLVWTIHEKTLAAHLTQYILNGTREVLNDWKKSFSRASVAVFPNYALPITFQPWGLMENKGDSLALNLI